MKYTLDEGAYEPERAHEFDAGLDLRSREDHILLAGTQYLFDTGVHVQFDNAASVGMIFPRSGLSAKHGVVATTGVIDSNYRGSIGVVLRNYSGYTYKVNKGEKIAQLVIMPVSLEKATEGILGASERGSDGFGSTGR